MQYLLDTNAVIRHFSNFGKIGKQAKKAIKKADTENGNLFISVISLMEIMYLAEKNRIPVNLSETINKIETNSIYSIIDFDTEILLNAEKIDFYELHDRLILATAIYFNIPIISSDKKFKEIEDIELIWD